MKSSLAKNIVKFIGLLIVLGVMYKFGLLEKKDTANGLVTEQPKPEAVVPSSSVKTPENPVVTAVKTEDTRPIPVGAYHGFGKVYRLLRDDTDGTTHQKFLLRLDNGDSLLVAHNTSLAPRLNSLKIGDVVEFCGEFVDNDQGGLVHWTHRDPGGRHANGWLKHNGKIYE